MYIYWCIQGCYMEDNGNDSELTDEEIKQLQREFLDALIWQLSLVSKGGE